MRFHFLLIPGNTYEILPGNEAAADRTPAFGEHFVADFVGRDQAKRVRVHRRPALAVENDVYGRVECDVAAGDMQAPGRARLRSEEHTSELQSLMRISYAVFCLKKKKQTQLPHSRTTTHTNHA